MVVVVPKAGLGGVAELEDATAVVQHDTLGSLGDYVMI